MTFSEALKTVYKTKYANFNDRASRSEYWWPALFNLIVLLVIGGIAMSGVDYITGGFSALSKIMLALLALFWLLTIIPSLAVAVRRFHDQDKSGWFILLAFIPYVGSLILLVFMCLKGTSGENRFGPDPLA